MRSVARCRERTEFRCTSLSTLVVQHWRRPGKYWTATIVRDCSTVAAAFEYLDFVELPLARPGLPLDTLSDLVVVDATAANSTAGGDAPVRPQMVGR